MKAGRGRERPGGALVKDDRWPVPIHARGVMESFDDGIRAIDGTRPSLGARTRTRVDGHRGASLRRPLTSQVEQRHRSNQLEAYQPRVIPGAIDNPRLLKHLGEASARALSEVESSPGLQMWRWQMMVKAGCCRPISPERIPGRGMRSSLKVDSPAQRTRRQNMKDRLDTREVRGGWRLGELRHRLTSERGGKISDSFRRIPTP